MTKKVYKTAQGKTVDLGALILQNETTKAVGNMGVNARGDAVDSNGNIIQSRNKQASKSYEKNTVTPKADPVVSSAKSQVGVKQSSPNREEAVPDVVSKKSNQESLSGLAAAMAKAAQIEDEE